MESVRLEMRVNVKFLGKLGWKPAAIIEALQTVYENNCVFMNSTIYRWIQEFKEGRESAKDLQRSGRPRTSITEDHVAAVQTAVEKNRRVTIDAIAEEVGISHGSLHAILTNNLRLSKLSARWVPRQLRPEHKLQRIECALNLLNHT